MQEESGQPNRRTGSIRQMQTTITTTKKWQQPGEAQHRKRLHNSYPRQQQRKEPAFNIEFEGVILGEGVLEMMPDGYGFLRSSDYNYYLPRMMYMFLLHRSNYSDLKQAIPFKVQFVLRKKVKNILLC
jgi:hypothetical protein